MAKGELVARLEKPVNRAEHKGFLLFATGDKKGMIDGIYRAPMKRGAKKKAE